MSGAEEIIRATREAAVLFDMSEGPIARGRIEVRGEDRVRWLDGMISGDVAALEAGPDGSGCYATLLTHRGAIIADLHIARLGDKLTLESLAAEIPKIKVALEKFIIADDVELSDLTETETPLGLEGPHAEAILEAALGVAVPGPDDWLVAEIAHRPVLVARFGFSGEVGFQIRLSPADRPAVEAALDAVQDEGIVRGDAASLEVLRVEAGIPALGRELDDSVLPPEARLERAISTTKGCYVGQEIVARLRSRGQVNHLLVGLAVEEAGGAKSGAAGSAAAIPATAESALEVGAVLSVGGKKTGEVTSVALSPSFGPIALGYVRREHAEAGTRVEFERGEAVVCDLPFASLRGEKA